jgi:hypothetical protein
VGWIEERLPKYTAMNRCNLITKMHELMLGTTPRSVSIFSAKNRAIGAAMMLTMKAIAEPPAAESGLFAIHSPRFQGFQYGDPAASKRTTVSLFDQEGELEFTTVDEEGRARVKNFAGGN